MKAPKSFKKPNLTDREIEEPRRNGRVLDLNNCLIHPDCHPDYMYCLPSNSKVAREAKKYTEKLRKGKKRAEARNS